MKKRRSLEFRRNSDIIDFKQAKKERSEKRRAEARLEEQKAKAREAKRPSVRRRRQRRKVLVIVLVVFLTVALIFAASLFNIVKLKSEEKDALAEQEALKDKKTELRKELKEIDNDEYVERKARELLRMVKPGELLFIFEDSGE